MHQKAEVLMVLSAASLGPISAVGPALKSGLNLLAPEPRAHVL